MFWRSSVAPDGMAHPYAGLYASSHQPSRMLTLSTPLAPAFIPLVPLASKKRFGLVSHTSEPCPTRGRRGDPRHDGLAGLVGGMRLSGEQDLHRFLAVAQQPREPLAVLQDEV